MESRSARQEKVRAWDLPTRLFHWLLVTLIASAWISFQFSEKLGDFNLRWHRWNGYAILVLIVWRLLWGLVGSSTSRFANFVKWPWTAAGYGLDLLRGRDRHFLGHNPLGTYMILALLGLVALQGTLGLFTLEHNDTVAGPLKRLVSDEWVKTLSYWHRRGFNFILALVVLHVIANVVYQFLKKDPLITGMITGRKPAAAYEDEAEARISARPMLRAFLWLIVAAGIVFGGILALGGKLT
jgi:cytochrome b